MILEINKKVLLNENNYLKSAIGLGLGAGLGAGLSQFSLDQGIENLDQKNEEIIDNLKQNIPGSVATVEAPPGMTISGDTNDETITASLKLNDFTGTDSFLPKINVETKNGQIIDVKEKTMDLLGNDGIKKILNKHNNEIIGGGALLGGATGAGLAIGVGQNQPKKSIQETSVIGKITSNGTNIKLPKQASKKTIQNRLNNNKAIKPNIKNKEQTEPFTVSEEKNPFKTGSIKYNKYNKDFKFNNKYN